MCVLLDGIRGEDCIGVLDSANSSHWGVLDGEHVPNGYNIEEGLRTGGERREGSHT